MVSEPQVWDALPRTGWLREFVEHCARNSDSHVGFHVAAGLPVLALTVPITYGVKFKSRTIYPNIYSLIVSESGSGKDAPIDFASRMVQGAFPESEMETPGSPEEFIDSMIREPRRILIEGEFAQILSAAKTGQMEPLKARMTRAFDCKPLDRPTVEKRRKNTVTRCETPRLSVLSASAQAYLEDLTREVDWAGGFFPRFYFMKGTRKTRSADPTIINEEDEAKLIKTLQEYRETRTDSGNVFASAGVGVFLGWTERGLELFKDWHAETESAYTSEQDPAVAFARARVAALTLRIAGLIAWDIGDGRSQDGWFLDERELEAAIKITRLHVESMVDVFKTLSPDRDMRNLRRLVEATKITPTPISEIAKIARLGERDFIFALKMAERMRLIEPTGYTNGKGAPEGSYRKLRPGDEWGQGKTNGDAFAETKTSVTDIFATFGNK